MLPQIQKLLRLQELDSEIRALEQEIKQLPAAMEKHRADARKRAAFLQKLESELEALTARRRATELELKGREQQLAKYRAQALQIKTPKELAALEQQIGSTQNDVSRMEEEVLGLMEKEEALARELSEKRQISQRMDARGGEELKRSETLLGEKQQLSKGLREDRIAAVNALADKDLAGAYEWLLKMHGPPVVVTLDGEACAACRGILVPHVVLQARLGHELVQCTHCQRFLYTAGG